MEPTKGANRALALSTIAFAVSFAVWGLLAGLAPIFKQRYGLSATQVSLMVSIPVLLGSLGRLPMGLLADRKGAAPVMAGLLMVGALPAIALAFANRYEHLVFGGFILGLAGTAFSVGVAMVSPWFPRERQGFALGVFGAGNIGQSLAVFGGPLIAGSLGHSAPFLIFGAASFIWGIALLALAQPPPVARPKLSLSEALAPIRGEPLCWLLSLFYFLTFGGFVALGVYMPSLLKEVFQLAPTDAGARTAFFVILATSARPIGGVLSDRMGGARVLAWALTLLAGFSLLLSVQEMAPFTVGALGVACCLGLGNGAVFKLVPQYFPDRVGTITGLVGAAGGLGGFFPPLALGVFKDRLGVFWPGFILMSLFAVACLMLDRRFLMGAASPSGSTTDWSSKHDLSGSGTGRSTRQ